MVCVLWFLVCTCNMNCDPNSGIIISPICGLNARQYGYLSWNIFGRCCGILPLAFQCISLMENILMLNMISVHEFGCCSFVSTFKTRLWILSRVYGDDLVKNLIDVLSKYLKL